jgi:hypothetical protein
VPTANVSEWYAGRMTVNELITQLDLLPADADVLLVSDGVVIGHLSEVSFDSDTCAVSLSL